jgi:MFS transporter, DHA3 family, macrolide efflux protein
MTDPTGIAPRALGVRDVLRIREYRLIWLGQLISEAGDGLTNLTLLLLVNALTGSTAALAGMAIVLAIPPLTIGLVAGTYVDRIDRRRIMLASDLLRGIVVLGFILVGSTSALWLLYILAFVQSAVGTFFTPARGALLPRIVPGEGLLAANSLAQATRVISSVVGSALAGLIVGLAGTFWPAFVIDSATFFVSFALISRLPGTIGTIEATAHAAAGIGASLLVGVRTIGRSRILSTTMVAMAVSMLGLGAVNVLFVPFVVRVLHVGAVWLGPVELAQSASMILASGLIGVLARRLAPSSIVTIGMAGVALTIFAAGGVSAIWQLLVLMFVIGWFIVPLQAAVVTILQQSTPDGERGRVMAVVQASMSAASVLSMGFAGIAGDVVGVREVFTMAAAITGLGFVVAAVGYRGAPSHRLSPAEPTAGAPTAVPTAAAEPVVEPDQTAPAGSIAG